MSPGSVSRVCVVMPYGSLLGSGCYEIAWDAINDNSVYYEP
jgi:hypothetical protein